MIQVSRVQNSFKIDVSASSSWMQTTESDFKNGNNKNVSISSKGEIKLASQTIFSEDDFKDESKIKYKDNIQVDTTNGIIKYFRTTTPLKEKWRRIFNIGCLLKDCSIQQTLDGGYITVSGFVQNNNRDILIIKTDSLGIEQWNRTFGGPEYDNGLSIQNTLDGGYIIAGGTKNYGAGYIDAWLIKIDKNGNEQWNRTFGSSGNDICISVQQTSDNGYVLFGWRNSTGEDFYDVWIVKTNSTGIETWNKTFGGIYDEYCRNGIQTSDGGFILIGYTSSYGAGEYDILVIKTNSLGVEQWNFTFGRANYDIGYSIQQTSDDGYIITGYTENFGAVDTDALLIKLDKNGNEQWNKTFGTSRDDSARDIQISPDGGFVITGYTDSYVTQYFEVWLIKTNNLGVEEWNVTFDNNNKQCRGLALRQTSEGGYIIAGVIHPFESIEEDIILIKTNCSELKNGTLISNNLIENQNSSSINLFNYSSIIPSSSLLKIQFSQDNKSWYNSQGILNEFDFLMDGKNSIDLSSLGWKGSNFYYNAIFFTSTNNILELQNINISFNQYYDSGIYESQPIYNQRRVFWKSISWDANIPNGTEIKFQFRSSENWDDLDLTPFLGPNGNNLAYYTTSGEALWQEHNNDYAFQFKAYFNTINTSVTPILEEVCVIFNEKPLKPLLNEPINNTWVTNNKPTFSWIFNDIDSTLQGGFQWQMDNNPDFRSVDYDRDEINSELHSFTPNFTISDGIWYWRVRTKDSDGDWGYFSGYSVLKIDTVISKPIKVTTNPSSSTSNNSFKIDWINPEDLSGIKTGAFYSIGKEPPRSQDDGTWISKKPFEITNAPEGENYLYVWLEDEVGNKNYQNCTSTILKLDTTVPINLSLLINDNARYTNSTTVNLNVSAIDLLSGINNMSFSFNNYDWTLWEPFAITKSITLPPEDGERSIYFRVNDKAYNTAQISGSIILDTTPPHPISILINNDEFETNSTNVTLNLTAIDSLSGVHQMSFSYDGSIWSKWENYSDIKLFNLKTGDGEKILYFRVIDHARNIANPVFDTIFLNTSNQSIDSDNGEAPEKKDPSKKDDSIWLIISIVIIIIILIVILLFFLLIKRKKKGKVYQKPQLTAEREKETKQQLPQQPKQQPQIQPTIQPQQKNCSTCGSSLKYYQQNNKYYCHHCKKYE